MSTGAVVLAVSAPVAVAGAWLVVRSGRASLWLVNGMLLPVLGILSLTTGLVEVSGRLDAGRAVFLGLTAGAGLYAATAAFMALAGRWPPLARHTSALYESRSDVSLTTAMVVSTVLVAPGEELVWRGVVFEVLRDGIGASAWMAGVVAWAGYVAANAASASVPILLGAVVGGAAWTALAVLTGGVLASIACHAVWTGLMVAFPPVPKPR
jgi:membrane protease YdiL (CAAX protease family)